MGHVVERLEIKFQRNYNQEPWTKFGVELFVN
jgi:hypothetical protein